MTPPPLRGVPVTCTAPRRVSGLEEVGAGHAMISGGPRSVTNEQRRGFARESSPLSLGGSGGAELKR